MGLRTLTLAELVAGRVPHDMTGVRWPDGTVECRANLVASDYVLRLSASGQTRPAAGVVLTDQAVACDQCADKCVG